MRSVCLCEYNSTLMRICEKYVKLEDLRNWLMDWFHYNIIEWVYGCNQSLALSPLKISEPLTVTNITSSNLTPATPSIYTPTKINKLIKQRKE